MAEMESRMSYREYLEWLAWFAIKEQEKKHVPNWREQQQAMLMHANIMKGKRG